MIREIYELEGLLSAAKKLRGEEKTVAMKALYNDLHDTEARVAADPGFMDYQSVKHLHALIHAVHPETLTSRLAQCNNSERSIK